jgi:hypothetical protein
VVIFFNEASQINPIFLPREIFFSHFTGAIIALFPPGPRPYGRRPIVDEANSVLSIEGGFGCQWRYGQMISKLPSLFKFNLILPILLRYISRKEKVLFNPPDMNR